ncbi:16S ribosomal RNA methyltransferase A [Halorhabdus sp. BNX81]|uniref:16S ribosomal RNA methyltransferase A n=1 Tax=Halorhabdus sp. BNX81 TaxID=2980181 RepID=UPI0023DD564E|nr:16S ribosomal RNA methyltransferase A [Halorhabdus sp. BNX81]WEL22015.1 16S rRNA (adenine1518-N6/adenine1519-N6)-dimethyltransferase [Halorhabdus sp. BNX81]
MAGEDSANGSNAGSRDPDALLARADARGDPDQDQHFLVDDRVLDRIPTYATEAGIDLGHVLEIGAGNGALTDRLLAVADRVTAVERDPDLAAFLRTEFADAIEAGRLTVIEGDALEVDLPDYTASISNLPYGASSEILFRLLPAGKPLIAMVQREFADRMAADPGSDEYGRLSVTAGHYADVEVVEPVPPEAFSPPPAVESALVRGLPREPDYTVPEDDFFLGFVKAVFTQRRKTVRNGIRNTAHISGLDDPDAVVDAADEELLRKRAGDLSRADFAELASLAHDIGLDSDD